MYALSLKNVLDTLWADRAIGSKINDTMATQDHFAQTLRRVCAERGWEFTPHGVRVRFASGRQQVVEIGFFEFQQEDLVRLHTTIGKIEELDPVRRTVALRINAELAHGALAVMDDDLVMTDTLMLNDADFGEIEASIRFLAETADDYEQKLFGTDLY